jgi:dimethylaniline monooxygenase (N-oxide forming)
MSDSKPGQGRLIAIIGAGPSGLVTAKYALEQGFKVEIYEAEAEVGGTFRYRAYENSELVSSRQLTGWSGANLGFLSNS